MSTDLDIRTDSLEDRTCGAGTELRIDRYGFFANNGENRYTTAIAGEQARRGELREEIFTPAFPGQPERLGGAEQVKKMSIFETAPKYTQGLYAEAGSGDAAAVWLLLLFVGICIGTFFLTRGFRGYKRRKAAKCISP
jgi:hypothetical protein